MGKVIVISNQKGGVGKTTTSVNLAAGLGLYDKKVLLIDLDPQGNATQGVGIDKTKCLKQNTYHLLIDKESKINDFIIKSSFQNLDIIAGSQDLAVFEKIQGTNNNESQLILRNKIQPIRNKYDYVIIDCPPVINNLTLNGIIAADSILVPVQCEFYALEGISQLLNTVKLVKTHVNPNLVFEGFLGTMYQSGATLSKQVYDELDKYFGKNLFKTYIRRNVSLAEAPSYGKPIMYYEKNCNGTQDYMNLVKEIIDNNE